MRRFATVLIVVVLALISVEAYALDFVATIIRQEDAPIRILDYRVKYDKGYGDPSNRGIHHEISYFNATPKKVVAVEFGLTSFDIWNELLGRTNGNSIEDLKPIDTTETDLKHRDYEKGTWIHRPYAAFLFHTGVAFLNKVRFEDGTIWSSDPEFILGELRKVQADLQPSEIEEQKD